MNSPASENLSGTSEWKLWTEFQPSILQSNLDRIKIHHPSLFPIVEPFLLNQNFSLRTGAQGLIECAIAEGDEFRPLLTAEQSILEEPSIQRALKGFSSPSHSTAILCLGFDLGNTLSALIHHLNQTPQKAIVFIEPDIQWFALTLAARNQEIILQSNRCFFAIGEPWQQTLEEIFWENYFFAIDRPDIFFSLTARRPERIPLWSSLRSNIAKWMQQGRERYAREQETTVEYYKKKSSSPIQCILALYLNEQDGKAIPYIQQRFLDECQRQGIEIVYHHPSFRSDIGLMRIIAQEKPDVLLLINKSPSEYTERQALDRLRLPRMIWCMDDPNCFIREPFGENDFVFTWDLSYEDNLKSMQAQSIDHFPYVADLDGVEARQEERFRSPVSFIGQVKKFDHNEWGMDERTGRLVETIGKIKSLEPQRDYQCLILDYQQEFGVHIIDSLNDPIPQLIRYGVYIVANALRRIALLDTARPFGLKIYGNEDWLTLLNEHPLRECYAGPADPQCDVPNIFASSTINLNIHSLQALTSLNQRDFNCPLVGGFLLTDWVMDADRFFQPDREMAFYRDACDLPDKIAYYLQHDDERISMIERGRERVLREHTYASRVPQVLQILNARIHDRYE